MKNDKQTTQTIILGVLLLFVLGFGIYRVIGGSTQAASGTKTTESAKTSKTNALDADNNKVDDVDIADLNVKPVDPFIAKVKPESDFKPTAETKVVIPKIDLPKGRNPFPFAVGPLKDPNIKPIQIVVPEKDPMSELTLCGVVEGETNVAIIRAGQDTRYIVREGQLIDGKFRIKKISRNGVLLSCNGKNRMLQLVRPSAS